MRRLRRSGTALALAAALALTTVAATATVRADGATTTSLTQFCTHLGNLITWLEAQNPGPLRDYLLRVARAAFTRHCT